MERSSAQDDFTGHYFAGLLRRRWLEDGVQRRTKAAAKSTAALKPAKTMDTTADRALHLNLLLASVGLEAQQAGLGLGPCGRAVHVEEEQSGGPEHAARPAGAVGIASIAGVLDGQEAQPNMGTTCSRRQHARLGFRNIGRG